MAEFEKGEGLVIELGERVKKGELTPRKAREELYAMGLHHSEYEMKYIWQSLLFSISGILLCFLPLIAQLTRWEFIGFFAQLPSIYIDPIIIIIFMVVFLTLAVMGTHAAILRRTKGGTKDGDEPIIHIRKGPYAIMRHPTTGMLGLFLAWITICFSAFIPFTLLSIIGNILFFIAIYYGTKGEEEFNVIKWGQQYRQFQKEVPRFNFLLGIVKWIYRKF